VGLDQRARRANLAGSMAAVPARLAVVTEPREACAVVVVDDLVTTGATLAEAVRALAAVGAGEPVVAVVAARELGVARSSYGS
jgi:predicted amidophosphoribosyltransferase